jgi:hypothetical protein
MNAVVDRLGAIYRRPGLKTGDLLDTVINAGGLEALHCTYDGTVYAVGPETGAYSIYNVCAGGATKLSLDHTSRLIGTKRPIITETEAILAMAAGDVMQKVILSTDVSSRLGGTPPEATHVVANRLRLLANDPKVDKSKIRYSDIATGSDYAGHEVWSFAGVGTSGYTSAEARPDPIVALHETADSVFVYGSNNMQVFVPDANLVYAPSTTLEIGCSAPYSVIRVDQAFAWLDHQRRFVLASAQEFKPISGDIASDLESISTISDCFGYRLIIGNSDLLVWKFPTDGRTFVYQIGGGWSQWAGFDESAANWKTFKGSCFAHNEVTHKSHVGTSDGYIAAFDVDTYTDIGDKIRTYVESGFVNRGTDNRKHCKAVHVRMRKTINTASSPIISISYADEPGRWSEPVMVDFGYSSETETVVTLRSMGVYRNRNWRFEFSEDCNMVLSGITEDYDVLGV